MHGACFRSAVCGAQACAGCGAEFGVEGVEDPGVVVGEGGEDVDVHFLENVEGAGDVVVECEWECSSH